MVATTAAKFLNDTKLVKALTFLSLCRLLL